jgi:hypothetical protein
VTWSFIIDLAVSDESKADAKIPNGVIEPSFVGVKTEIDASTNEELRLPTNLTATVPSMSYVLDNRHEKIKKAMRYSIGIKLGRAARNIEKLFHGIGRFMYPGAGELAFGKPMITEHGHIVASVDYFE